MATLQPKITESQSVSEGFESLVYTPTEKEENIVSNIIDLFRNAQNERDANLAYFDNRNLIEYIDDSVRRFVSNIDEREDIEDWQARVSSPFTRNKVLAILGKVVDAMPIAIFKNRGDEDIIKTDILNTLFEYSEEVDSSEEFFVYLIEEAIVKGTAIGYEGIISKDRNVREIRKFDGDEIKTVEGKIKERILRSEIVPLEDFYPSSPGIRRIEDMPYCFWRKVIPYNKFLSDFQKYEKATVVSPYGTLTGSQSDNVPFYKDYLTSDLNDGEVEVLRYYNKETDEHVIISNGIWLNPIDGEIVSPLPFNHKELPFYSVKYDILGSDFFYGKSLPDRLKMLQDVMNVLHNMLLDQSFLTIFPPILVAGYDDIEDDFLRPGRRIEVDTGGLPINQAYQQLDLGTPTGWHQFILEYTKRILEESSVDQITQGVAGVGGRTTATEIRGAAAGVVSLLGLFSKFVKFAVKRRAKLRAQNILQFYTDPDNPIIQQLLGESGAKEFNKAFNVFEVDSSSLTPGGRGTKMIELYKDINDLPTSKQLKVRSGISEKMSGKKVSITAVTPDYLRNISFDVETTANPGSESSKEIDRALEIQFQQTFLGLHGDLANRKELAAELAEKFGKDPRKVIREDVFEARLSPQGEGESGGLNQLVPGQGGDNPTNTIRGNTGVGDEGNITRDL